MINNPNSNNHDSSSGLPKFPSQLPESFWNESQRLRNIRDFARSRKVSPDAILHVIFAVIAAHTDQKCDTGLGKPAAASWYTFIVGPSGAGKNRAIEAGLDYLNIEDDLVRQIGAGTHQGVIQAYMTKTKDGNYQSKHGVLMITDEGAQFVAPEHGEDKNTGFRKTGCTMYTGTQDPGQANASAETSRSLPGDGYTVGWIVGIQNGFAVKFMKQGAEQGLTQRVSWASLVDAHRVKGVPEKVAATPINNSLLRIKNSQAITFDKEITKILMEDDDVRNDPHNPNPGMTGGNPLNAHMPLQLSKAALLLSILHDQTHVDMKMWGLAEQVVKTSYQIRDSFIKEAMSEASAARQERLQEGAYEKAVVNGTTEASSSREFFTERALDSALAALIAHTEKPLGRSCPKGGHSFSCAWKSLNSRKRGELAHLKNQLQVMFNEVIEGQSATQQLQSQPSEAKADVSAQMSEAETPVSSESVPPSAPSVIIEEPPLPISAQGCASDEMLEVLDDMEEIVVGTRHRQVDGNEAFSRVDSKGVDEAEALARFACRRAEYSRELCEGDSPEHKRWTQLIHGKFQADIDEAACAQLERELASEIQAVEAESDRLNEQNKGKPLALADLSQYENYQSPELEAFLAGNGSLPGFSEVA